MNMTHQFQNSSIWKTGYFTRQMQQSIYAINDIDIIQLGNSKKNYNNIKLSKALNSFREKEKNTILQNNIEKKCCIIAAKCVDTISLITALHFYRDEVHVSIQTIVKEKIEKTFRKYRVSERAGGQNDTTWILFFMICNLLKSTPWSLFSRRQTKW